MDLFQLIIFIILILFGFISIKSDFKFRKVSNKITALFFLISFSLFIFNLHKLVWFDFILLFIVVFVVFYIYKKNIWGAADGKIFLSISFLMLSLNGSENVLNFVINLLIFYLISMFILITIRTKISDKLNLIKKYNYLEESFLILFIYLIIRIIFVLLPFELNDMFITLFVLIFILIIVSLIRKQLRKYLKEIHFDEMLFLCFLMFATLTFVGVGLSFIRIFLVISIIKLIMNLMSQLSEKSGKTNEKYHSPFTLYMFISALFTLIVNKSMIVILITLFI